MTWLKKFLNNNLTRVLFICLLALVYIGGWCEIEHPLNPNLKLVVGDTTSKYDTVCCGNPVVSSNGATIYYLRAPADSVEWPNFSVGSVYSININGTDHKKILNGKFHAIAISHADDKLALHSYKSYYNLEPESLILVYNLVTSVIDSYPVPQKRIRDMEFSKDDEWIYYTVDASNVHQGYNRTEFYRLHLSDSSTELLQAINWYVGVDLFKNDSIHVDSIIQYPQINPGQEVYIIGTSGEFGHKFLMRDISKDTLITLPDSLKPYEAGSVSMPYWFPGGHSIVFAASPYKEGGGGSSEIWILENVIEQIGGNNEKH